MDASRLLLLIFVVMSTSECSETADPLCVDKDKVSRYLPEGEAFYHKFDDQNEPTHEELTWYKNNSKIEYISSDEKERVHYHGGELFFLNLLPEDSGIYTARRIKPSGECKNYIIEVDVFDASDRRNPDYFYGDTESSDKNIKVPCPEPVTKTCDRFGGNFTWYKNFSLLQGNHLAELWVKNAIKDHEGIYTCICTWTHNHKVYNSSASRMLIVHELEAHDCEILSPINMEQFADEGYGIKLNCSVFCGTNVNHDCQADWVPVNQKDGYNQTTKLVIENPSKSAISTAILTIEKVSAEDFVSEFQCTGTCAFKEKSATLTLKRRESIIPLVLKAVFVFFFCVFAAVLVKCFAIDLALLFRPYFPHSGHNKDARLYDAYVVYQMLSMDKATEETLSRFVTQILPSVLEEKCGYRLFIHGRDDIPGEDRLERVEDSIKQSRRLMVILTPGSSSGSENTDQCPTSTQNSVIGGFDWQVGLHHALVQREMSVILIQLGDTGPQGYTHLPAGLQHLIRKSAPLRWPEGSRAAASWNSRFWKRVRYLMPATPANKCPQSAVI
ncbi:interleukin-1 receptor-like 1 [Trachinotus anak]|uniref:interleukin-1 receptor-like 1 n=1 Tax=Trachinotus anak TaxID=443729 RepID=UPI0039F22074